MPSLSRREKNTMQKFPDDLESILHLGKEGRGEEGRGEEGRS